MFPVFIVYLQQSVDCYVWSLSWKKDLLLEPKMLVIVNLDTWCLLSKDAGSMKRLCVFLFAFLCIIVIKLQYFMISHINV